MTLDPEARTLVAQLVAALGPLTGCDLQRLMDEPRLPDEKDSRLIPFQAYHAADAAVAAAMAALAGGGGQ